MDIFSDEFIDSINQAQSYWTAAKVWPENITIEHINNLSRSVRPKLYQHEYKDQILHPPKYRIESHLPEHFDLRENWPQCRTINKVRDQGLCESCWAFVAASVLTDRFCIATKGAVNFEFSAEDILTCCLDKCHLRPENQCAGGRMDKAWDFLTDKGAVSGGEYMSNEVKSN
ncbi:Peptidase C1 and/or Propeptide C1 domain containing protein [Asbolus verrucosus]|uniref:Peptidase C1 and/or Propeptide C1 domain containing protein n=1 Tax=Asbolus verrucosus TaxID=1661398 RepID=A0A482VGD7_ASBVE|nr:Peptidase C1 and/or Propeptide C1 domain containing protein [Asbolus verrucosus]